MTARSEDAPTDHAVGDLLAQLSRWQDAALAGTGPAGTPPARTGPAGTGPAGAGPAGAGPAGAGLAVAGGQASATRAGATLGDGSGEPRGATTAAPRLRGLATLDSLARSAPAERGLRALVLADQDDIDRLVTLGEPWPGLLVAARGAALPAQLGAVPTILVDSTRLALATLSASFDDRPQPVPGVHQGASIDPSAVIGAGASVADGVVVSAGAQVGAGSQLRENCFVGHGVVLGKGCVLHPNVTVYDGVRLGERVIVHAGSVIGADGFGYAASRRGAVKIRHLGGVVLHDEVEIGANSAVDRGTVDDTVIGPRTKIDNLCQIGHNVRIGSDCLIAGMTGVAGSVVIGDGVIIGGAVGIADHVSIGPGARIAGRSGVTKDVPAGETWAGFPARPYRQYARSLYLADRLERIWRHVRESVGETRER